MRLALFSDIHGNREALAACLAHAAREAVDRFVFLGDYVGYGADPAWVVDEVMRRVADGAVAIQGNHDAAVVGASSRMNPMAEGAIAWTRHRLQAAQIAFLAELPLIVEEGERLFVHASADQPDQWDYVLGPWEAERSLAATACRVTFCGHVHQPTLFRRESGADLTESLPRMDVDIVLEPSARWLAVIGSVGQPRDGNPDACYAVFDDQRQSLRYVRVPYDVATAAAKIRKAGLPEVLARRLGRGV